MIETAAILARGLGTRMQRADHESDLSSAQASAAAAGAKGMIPFARPFLDYSLSALADAGIRHVVLVVAPEHGAVQAHYTARPPQRVRLSFAVQAEPLGTADAVVSAAEAIGARPFLVLNADNLYPTVALRALAELNSAGVAAFERTTLLAESNIEADRVRQFALLSIRADGRLQGIVEKPAVTTLLSPAHDAPPQWVSMNAWAVTPAIVDACRRVPLSARGEFELPEAVARAIADGVLVQTVPVHAGVLDLSHRRDIAAVAQRLRGVIATP